MAIWRVAGLFIALASGCLGDEAWVIGPRQRDPGAVEDLLERASSAGARVWRDGARFIVAGALGDLPRETGVEVEPFHEGDKDDVVQTTDFGPPGSLRGGGEIVTLDHAENAAFLGASFLLDRVEGVAWAKDGTFILDSAYASGSSARALNFARQFGLRVTMAQSAEPVYELRRPRLGVATGEAWVTALLERYRVPFERVSGDWHAKFDTLIVASNDTSMGWSDFASAGGTVIRLPGPVTRGSFQKAHFEPGDPIAFGMPREEWVHSDGLTTIQNEARGKGRIISFAFPPDTYATCKLLLNAIYLGSARKL